jgi:hypothetical protein
LKPGAFQAMGQLVQPHPGRDHVATGGFGVDPLKRAGFDPVLLDQLVRFAGRRGRRFEDRLLRVEGLGVRVWG